jgi:hypothetical protein
MAQLMPILHALVAALAVALVAVGGTHLIITARQRQKEQVSGKHSKYHHGTPRRLR